MSDSTPYAEAQMLARITLLERVVGMMIRDDMIKSGKSPEDILAFGEVVKASFHGQSPEGTTDREFDGAAARFFSAIASDVGSQDSQ